MNVVRKPTSLGGHLAIWKKSHKIFSGNFWGLTLSSHIFLKIYVKTVSIEKMNVLKLSRKWGFDYRILYPDKLFHRVVLHMLIYVCVCVHTCMYTHTNGHIYLHLQLCSVDVFLLKEQSKWLSVLLHDADKVRKSCSFYRKQWKMLHLSDARSEGQYKQMNVC